MKSRSSRRRGSPSENTPGARAAIHPTRPIPPPAMPKIWGGLQMSTSRPKAACQALSKGAARIVMSAPIPMSAMPSSARSGPTTSARPRMGRPADRESSYDDPPARLALAAEREPPEREPRDPLELAAIHGLGRGHEGSRASRLHFDEHVTGAIAAHEVDLSESRASVARDDGH